MTSDDDRGEKVKKELSSEWHTELVNWRQKKVLGSSDFTVCTLIYNSLFIWFKISHTFRLFSLCSTDIVFHANLHTTFSHCTFQTRQWTIIWFIDRLCSNGKQEVRITVNHFVLSGENFKLVRFGNCTVHPINSSGEQWTICPCTLTHLHDLDLNAKHFPYSSIDKAIMLVWKLMSGNR